MAERLAFEERAAPGGAATPVAGRRPIPWRRLVVLYVSWSVVGHAVLALAAGLNDSVYAPGVDQPGWLAPTAYWDGGWYHAIAELGYTFDARSTAFFPMLPGLLRAFGTIGIGTLAATLLIDTIAAFVAVVALHELVADRHGLRTAWRTVVLFLVFPWSLFLLATYTEALVCAFGFGAFLAAQRGRWLPAFVLAGFASACRFPGVLVGVFVILLYLRDRDWSWRRFDRNAWVAPLAFVGLAAYSMYLWSRIGDPLDFRSAYERAPEWGRSGFEPNVVASIGESLHKVIDWTRDEPSGWVDAVFVELTGLVPWLVGVAVIAVAWWRRTIDRLWTGYAAAGLALAASQGIFVAANRYMLPLFGFFVAIAVWVDTRPRLYAAIVTLSTLLLFVYTARFGAQKWAG